MSTIIQIKRSNLNSAPSTLELGELAYSYDQANAGSNAVLYIGVQESSSNVIQRIGGKYYTSQIEAATSLNTPDTLVKRSSNGSFAGHVTSSTISNTANSWTNPITVELSGSLSGNVLLDGTQNVTLTANFTLGSVVLGKDTAGDYVNNVLAGAGIVVTGQGGETANVTVALANSGVTALSYGGTTSIPVFTVDQYGRITSAANTSVATNLSIAGDTGTDTLSLLTDTLNFLGTASKITTTVTNNTVTFSLPNNVIISNNLTVLGDFLVNGNVSTLNTSSVVVEDPLIKLANANPSDSLDLGFYASYNSGGNKYAGLFRDASDSGRFKLFDSLQSEPTTTVDIAGAGYNVGTLISNLTAGNVFNLLSAIGVADGGTGRNVLTANGVMYANTTTAFAFATGSEGHVLQISNGIPAFGTLDGGSF